MVASATCALPSGDSVKYSSVEGFGCPQCGEEMMLRAVSVLPPLAMTLLRAMNWRGPPMWVGFTDA